MTDIATVPHHCSLLPADTSLSPVSRSLLAAATAFPPAGRVRHRTHRYGASLRGTTAPARSPSLQLHSATARARTQSLLQRPGVPWQMAACLGVVVTRNHAGPTQNVAVHGRTQSNLLQNACVQGCSSLSKQVPKGSFYSLEEQVCIYLISISTGRCPGLDPPILSVSLL